MATVECALRETEAKMRLRQTQMCTDIIDGGGYMRTEMGHRPDVHWDVNLFQMCPKMRTVTDVK